MTPITLTSADRPMVLGMVRVAICNRIGECERLLEGWKKELKELDEKIGAEGWAK